MQYNFSIRQLVLASMMLASIASAQTNRVITPADVEFDCITPLNRVGVSYRVGFNISAKFKNIGGFDAQTKYGAATNGVDHIYDDGYNRRDQFTNSLNLTAFWGYDDASQITNDTVVLSSSSSTANGTTKNNDEDPQHGFEINYQRELGHPGKCKWGIEAAVGFTDLTIGDDRSLVGDVMRISDAYALGGINPPPNYQATELNTGPLISDTPFRSMTTIPGGAVATGRREFDADIFGLRFGPYLEIPLSERISFLMSGGVTLLSVNSDFKFREQVTITGVGTQTTSGKGSHSDVLVGGYIGGNFNYAVAKNVNLFAGAQYQAAGTYSHKENGKEAELDLGNSVFVNLGIGFSF